VSTQLQLYNNNNNNNNNYYYYSNEQLKTDRTIPNNKPDIVIRNNEKGTCMLIDVANTGDSNVIQKLAYNILKYKDLTIGIQCTWNIKPWVITVIIGATRTISKPFI
jgi:hypothetical protein